MIKYRYLTDEELKHLELELKQFLIINNIYDLEWKKLNQENPKKAKDLIAIFSNQILHSVYEKIKYIEKVTTDACFFFHFDQNDVELIAFQKKVNSDLDFLKEHNSLLAIKKNLDHLNYFKTKKNIQKTRETEIHQLLEQGAFPLHKNDWEILKKMTT